MNEESIGGSAIIVASGTKMAMAWKNKVFKWG